MNLPLTSLPSEKLSLLANKLAEEKQRRARINKLQTYRPYPKQKLFHSCGLTCKERLLRAGNQQGKTLAGGMEVGMHLTGRYPDWWQGRRFTQAIDAWAACDTGETTRDNPQRVLMGPVNEWGTGAIPGDTILDQKRGNRVKDLLDSVFIRHASGGISRLGFKSYDQGRQSWQGPSKHVIWCDEEPPLDVYAEAMARLIATGGIIFTTFTPLKGMSEVVERLMGKNDSASADVNMTIDDAEHIPAAERAAIIASFPEHEREARANGVPILGSGRVFPVAEAMVAIDAIPIPPHWPCIGGMDFGWDHPFAAVKLAWDRDSDTIYVTAAYRARESVPSTHASAIRAWGKNMPWSWPHDGLQHDKASGKILAQSYREQALPLLPEHAQFAPTVDGKPGGFGVEAGVMQMLERMQEGRLRVFKHLTEWFEEFRLYHRKDGEIVKLRDDLMSATRIAMMSLRFAKVVGDAKPLKYPKLNVV